MKFCGDNKIGNVIQSIFPTIFGTYTENLDIPNSNGSLIEKLYKVPEISTPVQINAAGLIGIYIVITIIYYQKSRQEEKSYIKNVAFSVFLGLFLYIASLQLAYITQFSTKEMLNHDGMERYIASYLLGILYIIVTFALERCKKANKNILYIIITSLIVLITPITSVANATITSGIYNINTTLYCNMGRNRAEKIQTIVENEDKILGVCQDINKNLINLMVRYYLYPINYEVDTADDETFIEKIKSQQYDYLYLMNTNEETKDVLKSEFNIQEIEEDTIFRITEKGLEKVELDTKI